MVELTGLEPVTPTPARSGVHRVDTRGRNGPFSVPVEAEIPWSPSRGCSEALDLLIPTRAPEAMRRLPRHTAHGTQRSAA
jgi:hypothetical protein